MFVEPDRRFPEHFLLAIILLILTCLIVPCFSGGSYLLADESPLENQEKLEKLPVPVLSIIENGRRLRSGHYHATGVFNAIYRYEINGKREKRIDHFDEVMESDFDLDSDRPLFRCKRSLQGDLPAEQKFAQVYRWYLNVPDLTVILQGDEISRTVLLYPPTPWENIWQNEVNAVYLMPVYDPRLLGWAGLMATSFEKTISIRFLGHDLTETPEENGIHRIEYRHQVEKDLYTVSTWWCDEKQGWQPVRHIAGWDESAMVPPRPKNSSPMHPMIQADLSCAFGELPSCVGC